MFSGKEVPAVGVSIGIERVFAIMEAQLRARAEQVADCCWGVVLRARGHQLVAAGGCEVGGMCLIGGRGDGAAPGLSTIPHSTQTIGAVADCLIDLSRCHWVSCGTPCLPLQAGGTIRETETEVLVASIGNGMQPRRMQLCAALWAAGLKAEFGYKANPKMADQVRRGTGNSSFLGWYRPGVGSAIDRAARCALA
jgi:histidyl-tRNA synthetase